MGDGLSVMFVCYVFSWKEDGVRTVSLLHLSDLIHAGSPYLCCSDFLSVKAGSVKPMQKGLFL